MESYFWIPSSSDDVLDPKVDYTSFAMLDLDSIEECEVELADDAVAAWVVHTSR